jgi:excisionase family DNA binding protein
VETAIVDHQAAHVKRRTVDKLLTIDEAADRVGVSPVTIRRRIDAGDVDAVRVGPKLVKLRESAVDSLVQKYEKIRKPPRE